MVRCPHVGWDRHGGAWDTSAMSRSRLAVCVLVSVLGAGCGAEDQGDGETDGNGTGTDTGGAEETESPGTTTAGTQATSSTSAATTTSTTDPGTSTTAGPTTDPEPTTTAGSDDSTSGGEFVPPVGLACDQTFRHAGRQGCLSEVDGLQVKFFPLADPVPVQRIAVFLHGDGAADWTENWGFREEILNWADARDVLVLGIQSPASYDGDPDPAFGAAQPVHADMVATTLETFLDAYEVVEERQLYWGVSGGSWFTSSSYIPVAGHRVPGIFVANCGGSGVSFGWAWEPESQPEVVAANSLYFNYGDQDFLAEPSAESHAEYMALGFVTDQLVHPGATHCAHPIAEPTIDFWEREVE